MVIPGTVHNGHIVPVRQLELPEGAKVFIVPILATDPKRRMAALNRIRKRAVAISLPNKAFDTDSLYPD